MAPGDIAQMESYIDFMREHIRKCRKNHKKLSYSKMKFWTCGLYEWIVQTERFEKGLGPMVCGVHDLSKLGH